MIQFSELSSVTLTYAEFPFNKKRALTLSERGETLHLALQMKQPPCLPGEK